MKKNRQPAIIFIFFTVLIDVIGFGIIIPVFPRLVVELTGGGMTEASLLSGMMMFAFSLMQFLFSPILGNLSDRYGRRPILLFSLFGFGVDYLFLGFAPTIFWLFVGRIVAGITGASYSTASAYIADVSSPEDRGKNFGMIGAAFGLGFIIGPVLGGLLAPLGVRVPFFAAAGITLINWLYGYFILPESLKVENRRPFDWRRANPVSAVLSVKKYPGILVLFLSIFLLYMASHAVQSTWSFFTMGEFHWTESEVGYSLGFVGILAGLVQTVAIRKAHKTIGQVASVYLGLTFYMIGLVIFAFADHSYMMYIGLIPYCLSGLAGPSIQGIISSQVPANSQGELQGGLTSMMSVTAIMGPPLMTWLYYRFAGDHAPIHFPGAAFLVGSVFALLSLVAAVVSLRKVKISS